MKFYMKQLYLTHHHSHTIANSSIALIQLLFEKVLNMVGSTFFSDASKIE